jgi:hypothetical protein
VVAVRSRLAVSRPLFAVLGIALAVAACTDSSGAQGAIATDVRGTETTAAPRTDALSTSAAVTPVSTTAPSPATAAPTTTTLTTISTSSTSTTSTSSTTTSTTSTTSTTVKPKPEPKPKPKPTCVRRIRSGDSLEGIVAALDDPAVTVAGLQAENGIADPDLINAGDDLDICVANGVNDTTGEPREPDAPPPSDPVAKAVKAQQRKLNRLLAGTGFPPLAVDGDSGRYTQQALCAARLALGLPVSRDDMAPGSSEEQTLMAASSIPIPSTAPTGARRWALIDRTCQVMFAGEGAERLVLVFPTSTGSPGYETRDQNGSRVFRFDPARENGGWHNSTHYPVPADNPLNGNMYLPLYFDNGQAIHGANNVPTDPQSKGCVRLRVENQTALVYWLGLSNAPSPVWDEGVIDLSVSVQGQY